MARNAGLLKAFQRIALVLLLGIYSSASRLSLTPVYGSVPSSAWHAPVVYTALVLGFSSRSLVKHGQRVMALVAACVPTMQFFLFRLSQRMGPTWGPVLTEGATLGPLAALTASLFDTHTQAVLALALFKVVEYCAEAWMKEHVGEGFPWTRMGREVFLAGGYGLLRPSAWTALGLPAVLHAALANTHMFTHAGDAALRWAMVDNGWQLLDRRESVTGYVAVAQGVEGARVMRVDHSLLGGDWVAFRGEVSEPVYGVFVMLEAVRLVEAPPPASTPPASAPGDVQASSGTDDEAKALVIGLGVGSLPSALVTHGIDTTVVEIDPAVYELAKKHFDLKENNPAVLRDAVTYLDERVREGARDEFDYIVHDVFTGGAEPVDLFTVDFFTNMHALLKPDGVVAINYAGDLVLPTPRIILHTIRSVFPSCRIFRENPRDADLFARIGADLTNLVIFCLKAPANLTFRDPLEADYLNSRARQAYLVPQFEVHPDEILKGSTPDVLRKGETGRLERWQRRSATSHWRIMRTVLPPSFWENW